MGGSNVNILNKIKQLVEYTYKEFLYELCMVYESNKVCFYLLVTKSINELRKACTHQRRSLTIILPLPTSDYSF